MEKKYQIFISSTYRDLKPERWKVIEMLLDCDCIPVGMEFFPASDDKQLTVIKRFIDDCDYFVLIIGDEYGSIDEKTGKSYTRLEYEYAKEIGLPIAAFYKDSTNKTDNNGVHQEDLKAFIELVKGDRLCKPWNDTEGLAESVLISIIKLIKSHPRTGWVKSNRISSEESLSKIMALEQENKRLIKQVEFLCSSVPAGTERYRQGTDTFVIHYKLDVLDDALVWSVSDGSTEKSWDEIFLAVSTELCSPIPEQSIREKLATILLPRFATIDEQDFKTILIQLLALKLISTDVNSTEYDGTYAYWTLSPYGREYMVKLKAILK